MSVVRHFFLVVLLYLFSFSNGSSFARLTNNYRSWTKTAKAPPKKSSSFDLMHVPYSKVSFITGGTAALLQFLRLWKRMETSQLRLDKLVNGCIQDHKKTVQRIKEIEKTHQKLSSTFDSFPKQDISVLMENIRDIMARLKFVERSVKDLEDSYNTSMSQFEEFGEKLLDDTESRCNTIESKLNLDIAAVKSAVGELKTEVPRLMKQYDQRITKTIETYAKKMGKPAAKRRT